MESQYQASLDVAPTSQIDLSLSRSMSPWLRVPAQFRRACLYLGQLMYPFFAKDLGAHLSTENVNHNEMSGVKKNNIKYSQNVACGSPEFNGTLNSLLIDQI